MSSPTGPSDKDKAARDYVRSAQFRTEINEKATELAKRVQLKAHQIALELVLFGSCHLTSAAEEVLLADPFTYSLQLHTAKLQPEGCEHVRPGLYCHKCDPRAEDGRFGGT